MPILPAGSFSSLSPSLHISMSRVLHPYVSSFLCIGSGRLFFFCFFFHCNLYSRCCRRHTLSQNCAFTDGRLNKRLKIATVFSCDLVPSTLILTPLISPFQRIFGAEKSELRWFQMYHTIAPAEKRVLLKG